MYVRRPCHFYTILLNLLIVFWTLEGSQIATTAVAEVVVTLFEKCLRLTEYASDRKETSHTHS